MELVEIIYWTCLIYSVGTYFWLRFTDVKRSICQHAMIIVVIVAIAGFISMYYATDLNEAILAYKILFVGVVYLPLIYFLNVCEVCHIKINKKLSSVLLLIQTLIYGLVFTIGMNKLFYTNVEFVKVNGISQLVKEYGPLHGTYLIMVCVYYLLSILISINSMYSKKSVNNKELIGMILFGGVSVIFTLFKRYMNIETDLSPVIYVFLIVGSLYSIYQSNMFTVYENVDMVREQLQNVGFITLKRNFEYMGCDERASEIFPELKEFNVGTKISKCSDKLRDIILWVHEFDREYSSKKHTGEHVHNERRTFLINDCYYDGVVHTIISFRKRCVGYTIELRDETEHHRAMELQNRYNEELEQEVNSKIKTIDSIQEKTILGMAQMVESRDLSTGGHIKRTSDVVRIFSKELLKSDMGFDRKFLRMVIRSAPMHDLGKIGVRDSILRKQGRYEPDEYAEMKTHAEIGAKMVREILTGVEDDDFVKIAENVAHYHHEKVDGTGYPMGLKGDEIPVEARIMALCDVFDALVSKRCYKEAFSFDKAFGIIEKDSGTHFDSNLARVFMKCRPRIEEYYNKN